MAAVSRAAHTLCDDVVATCGDTSPGEGSSDGCANVDACIMALHLTAVYASDAVRKISLCERVGQLQAKQQGRRSLQLEHAASAAGVCDT